MPHEESHDLPEKLSQPALRALHLAGYFRLEQFAGLQPAEILRLHGVGPKTITQLREALSARGLSFADDAGSDA